MAPSSTRTPALITGVIFYLQRQIKELIGVMKFTKGSRRRAIEYEKDLVQYWKKHQTFEKSVEQRPATDAYVFYDGPPFITGVPHHGTLLTSIVKDAVPRYWTMKGKRVERVWGWDCHGLPAEVFTEKKLGIHDQPRHRYQGQPRRVHHYLPRQYGPDR